MTDSHEPDNPFAADVPGVEVKPATYVLFGASGDLAAKKLLPAVYNLFVEGRLPERFRLLGVGSRMPEHNFREHMIAVVSQHSRTPVDAAILDKLLDRCDYIQGDFTKPALFKKLT